MAKHIGEKLDDSIKIANQAVPGMMAETDQAVIWEVREIFKKSYSLYRE